MSESSDSMTSGHEPPRFCAECGSRLLPGAAFCAECGAPVLDLIDDSPAPAATPAHTSPSLAPSWPKLSKRALAIAGGAVLLILLIVAGYFAYQPFSGDEGYIHDEGFPVTFSEETLKHYSTPAQLVYFHVISEFYRGSGDALTVGSPQISDLQVDIRLKFDNAWENWRFVETENDGHRATVAVGLADAGAYEYYVVEKRKGEWTLSGTLGTEGF